MTELELYKAIINLAFEAELLGCSPISSDLIDTADYLQSFMSSSADRMNSYEAELLRSDD